jgi:hypothetical protein
MSINDEGYLSPDIAAWISKHRADNADWFALAGDLNRIAQCQLARLKVRDDDHQSLVVALCFMRSLSLFQGSIIMAERGMMAEARTLMRGCLETVFLMGAAQKQPDIGELLIQDDAHRREKIAKKILSNHEVLTEEDRALEATLTEFVVMRENSGLKGTPLAIRAVAKMGGLEAVYDTYYAALSNDSAHPSLTSLRRHLSPDDNAPGFRWGPDVPASDVGVAVSYACTACIYSIQIANDRFDTGDLGDRVGEAWKQYKRLIDRASGETQ